MLTQIKNNPSLNELPVDFDNEYDFVEESDEILPCIIEFENNNGVCSTTSCIEEEEEVVCYLEKRKK